MMVRTQLSLDPERHARAKQRAGEMGISLAEYVRRVIDQDLAREASPQHSDLSALIGVFSSGGADVARHKDQYVDRAFAEARAGSG